MTIYPAYLLQKSGTGRCPSSLGKSRKTAIVDGRGCYGNRLRDLPLGVRRRGYKLCYRHTAHVDAQRLLNRLQIRRSLRTDRLAMALRRLPGLSMVARWLAFRLIRRFADRRRTIALNARFRTHRRRPSGKGAMTPHGSGTLSSKWASSPASATWASGTPTGVCANIASR